MKNVLKKISEARKTIAETKMKKLGKNKFSNYEYFTPEQIYQITSDAEQKNGLISKFDLIKNENTTKGVLTIFDVETGENIAFEMATAIPEIKATNLTQQLGGAVTYTHRYLLTTAYKIAENHLDFDSDQNTPTNIQQQQKFENVTEKTWLTEAQFKKAMESDVKGITATINAFSTPEKGMKKEYKEKLLTQLNILKNGKI